MRFEQRVAAADDALCQAVARHSADMSAEEERFATYRTEAEARLAETAAARDTFARSRSTRRRRRGHRM